MSERASQMVSLVSSIHSNSSNLLRTTVIDGDVIDASLYDSVLFIMQVGYICSNSGKVVLTVYEGTASGTVSTSVDSVTVTQTTAQTLDKEYIMDVDCQYLTGPNYRYLKPRITTSGKASAPTMVALGFKPRFHPASAGDLASCTITVST